MSSLLTARASSSVYIAYYQHCFLTLPLMLPLHQHCIGRRVTILKCVLYHHQRLLWLWAPWATPWRWPVSVILVKIRHECWIDSDGGGSGKQDTPPSLNMTLPSTSPTSALSTGPQHWHCQRDVWFSVTQKIMRKCNSMVNFVVIKCVCVSIIWYWSSLQHH